MWLIVNNVEALKYKFGDLVQSLFKLNLSLPRAIGCMYCKYDSWLPEKKKQ